MRGWEKMVKNIMVVDDNPDLVYSVKYGLEDIDPEYKVTSAENGKKLFEILYSNSNFDVILIDIMMPDMSGWEVFDKLKEDDNWNKIPVIFITARNDKISKNAGFFLGDDFIEKPFEIIDLKNRIDKVLEKNKK